METIHQEFQVSFRYPVYFTTGLLDPGQKVWRCLQVKPGRLMTVGLARRIGEPAQELVSKMTDNLLMRQ